ncbi:hypothetical protein [Streptomyces sp. AV19]|uniref:hypothetical protein n=1 Tax=Streptomyces sp. AV19 TaxID=2793068 RepID=UPI002413A922|nr:hypothetical protein [Streptomyces sp. AV19]MDG4535280.1 hypothetical protein [Streptomyces sp. AV19]
MTGIWPPAELPGIHVIVGDRWREAAADYRCAACGWTDSATGPAVPGFVATIHRTHRAACPPPGKDIT